MKTELKCYLSVEGVPPTLDGPGNFEGDKAILSYLTRSAQARTTFCELSVRWKLKLAVRCVVYLGSTQNPQ